VGGYSSFPVLRFAQSKGLKLLFMKVNSFAGKANMCWQKKATQIFCGQRWNGKFFPAQKIIITGNPVRSSISQSAVTREEGIRFFWIRYF